MLTKGNYNPLRSAIKKLQGRYTSSFSFSSSTYLKQLSVPVTVPTYFAPWIDVMDVYR